MATCFGSLRVSIIPLAYLIFGIIFFPLGGTAGFRSLWPIIRLSFLPFGRELVSNTYLEKFKTQDAVIPGMVVGKSVRVANVLWLILPGWILALLHVVAGVSNLIWCALIFTIPVALPNAMGNFKMVQAALRPFGRTVISADLAKKLKETTADEEFTKLKGNSS